MIGRHAYGFSIDGIDSDALTLIDPGSLPTLHIGQTTEPCPVDDLVVRDDSAVLHWLYGVIVMERRTMSVTYHADPPLDAEELVHPCLWPAAALAARWQGHETLHGGGFLDDAGGAWVVVGDSGDGKSSLLGSLAIQGTPILADDLVVIDGRHCFAGPRCIDLLDESAQGLGVADATRTVRWSKRQRLLLDPVQARVPLRGFIHLGWDTRIDVRPVPPADRPALLSAQRRVSDLGVDPVALLDLSGLPALTLRRPRDWTSQREATGALLAAVANFAEAA
jgi:hypothetical protein